MRKKKGDKAVAALEQSFGRPLFFRRLEDVPVGDEVRIIELAYDLLHEGHGLTGAARERAAGRLHFANFSETTLGSALMHSMPHTKQNFRTLLFNMGSIARSVFKHSEFRAQDTRAGICVTMKNSGYPPEHFQGFFEAWMEHWGLPAKVTRKHKAPDVHEYVLAV